MVEKTSRKSNDPEVVPLLIPRRRTVKLLSSSLSTIIDLEEQGLLTKIRLGKRSPVANVYHKLSEVMAIANGEGSDNEPEDETEVKEPKDDEEEADEEEPPPPKPKTKPKPRKRVLKARRRS